ncbi:RCC1 domain-containing protein [Leucobacter luti]|uniref:Alpha-tubulin suppressor-like RCC1 family protein n=1 Tax=Leucobacter luti TaxID=340320 RepID=A0A4V6MCX9_9MICO|nr:hypothetical protein [Leucobacter luti]RZT66129.1 alpha-tubulin suppressor-like RCC1 family protein [Leucobacter luti]
MRNITRALGVAVLAGGTAVAVTSVALTGTTAAGYTDTAVAVESTITMPAEYLAVSTQFEQTSVALSGGYVWVWGVKDNGMSGLGVKDPGDASPKPVHTLPNVTKVVGASDLGEATGTFGALTEAGEVYTWGLNKLGRLGIGTTTGNSDYRDTPQKVVFPDNERVIDLGSMRATMAALTESGKVYTWGSGQYGQAGNGSTRETDGPIAPFLVIENAHSMHVGQRMTWVITRDNHVYWWGRSIDGENGAATVANNPSPELITQMDPFAIGSEAPAVAQGDPSDACNIQTLTSSRQASAMVTADGQVYTFGNSANGQTGRPGNTAVSRQIVALGLPEPVESVSAGNYHFTALTISGEVWGWGDNASWAASGNIRPDGSTGQGTTDAATPIKLPLADIIALGGSRDTSYATRADSVLIGWGATDGGAILGASGARATFTSLALPGIRPGS